MIRSFCSVQVHNVRRRARDREERLSSELSAAKAQLKEAMDLLATKEEESCLARAQRAEQEEKTVAAMARLTERDRRARWLERRLIEVPTNPVTQPPVPHIRTLGRRI